MVNIDHDAKAMAKRLHAANFRSIMVQTHVGPLSRHPVKTVVDYLEPYRALDFAIGHWGYLTDNPEADAECAMYWDGCLKPRFYVPNAEIEYKYTGPDGKANVVAFGRSDRFCNAYSTTTTTVGLSTYGRCDKADLHYAPWLNELNGRILPQAYMNEQGITWTPSACFSGAIDVKQPQNIMHHPVTGRAISGFPKSYVHCTIGKLDSKEDKFPTDVDQWITGLIAAKKAGHTVGFTVYEAENSSDADLAKLGKAIKDYKLAVV